METVQFLKKGTEIIKVFILCLAIIVSSGCVTYFGHDGPYEGRVIDADTRLAIEGAVVHGSWWKAIPGAGGASHKFYDSREVLTDKEGNFRIDGMGLLFFSDLEEMDVTVVKAGYTQQTPTPWSGLRSRWVHNVEWEGDKAIFKLRRMTLEERKKRILTLPLGPDAKQRLLRLESNKEDIEIGAPPNTLFPVE